MKFDIICGFVGFCGDKAVIIQEGIIRLVNYDKDTSGDLMDDLWSFKSLECRLDADGEIWITEVAPVPVV